MHKKLTKFHQAFTLIELLVVATIIGVLMSIAIVSFSNAQRNSRDAKRKADLETVRQALVLYRQDTGVYVYTLSCSSGLATACNQVTLSVPLEEAAGSTSYVIRTP